MKKKKKKKKQRPVALFLLEVVCSSAFLLHRPIMAGVRVAPMALVSLFLLTLSTAQAAAAVAADAAVEAPTGLQLAFLTAPLGVDTTTPTFAWQLPVPAESTAARQPPAAFQRSFRIVVSERHASRVVHAAAQRPTGEGKAYSVGAVVYDSGEVVSSAPQHVPTTPLPFASDRAYVWNVTVQGSESSGVRATSEAALFSTGLLRASDWAAEWVGGLNLLRASFEVDASTAAALGRVSVFVSSCQYYELYLDGTRIGVRAWGAAQGRGKEGKESWACVSLALLSLLSSSFPHLGFESP